jgi:hypothetical protein
MSLNSQWLADSSRSNGNLKPAAPRLARLLAPVIEREQAMITTADMQLAYVGFNYQVAALLQPPVLDEPQFPAISGRIAYCNGRYVSQSDTSVTYRRGRKVTTEWHALARIAA